MVDFHKLRELGFDSENAKERFLGSEEFYFSCMKIYIRANDIAKLTELCRACDWENALECVHTMKGSTGNLALYGLYSHYSAMTDLFRAFFLPCSRRPRRWKKKCAPPPDFTAPRRTYRHCEHN